MALHSQLWSLAASMPMAESSLYRQRLEVIAEKRRLQEEIRAVRRELEEEKLRVERLKRKSLRERWLMDGAAAEPEPPKDPDPQSPKGQAQAHIRNLEDSLFTLQSQLQLLQSASTGAQHKPSGRPTWRRQGHRPLSLPTVDMGPTGHADRDNRASLPARPSGESPDAPSEATEEAAGVLSGPGQLPGAAGASSEANGPCPEASPPREPGPSRGAPEADGGAVVRVVWEGLRPPEDCAPAVTGPELEARVEEVVLQAMRDRQGAGSPERPSWVKEGRGTVEAVWEGVGGTEGSEAEALGEAGGQPLRPPGTPEGEGAPGGSPEGGGQGGSGGDEGSFIWVERVTLTEEWEELQVEGLEGPRIAGTGTEGEEGPLGTERGAGEESWEVERKRAEESLGVEKGGGEEKPEAESKGAEEPSGVEKKGGEEKLQEKREGAEPCGVDKKGREDQVGTEREGEPSGAENKGGEDQLGTERERAEPEGVEKKRGEDQVSTEREGEPSRAENKGGEEQLGTEREGAEPTGVENKEGEVQPQAKREGVEPSGVEKKGGEDQPEAEREGAEGPLGSENKEEETLLQVERKGGEEALEAEESQEIKETLSPGEQREPEEGKDSPAEEGSQAGAPPRAEEQPSPGEGGLGPLENQEGSLEEEAAKPPTPPRGQLPPGDTAPLLAEPRVPEQPAECQPLLQVEEPSANPRARPTPTYVPARQPEPRAPAEGEEASGPKQKTCQCCAVM
ncbi:paralemmin-3 [Choloepus didactylus]|uniref:paralemmin-3 n=1 Tax=Choloepus didactylus TaxID=27675 RepID=UPI00189F31B4|nr:paralemmin-3 [Choloepus didactylus]